MPRGRGDSDAPVAYGTRGRHEGEMMAINHPPDLTVTTTLPRMMTATGRIDGGWMTVLALVNGGTARLARGRDDSDAPVA